jgi:hypothetical protein
MEFREKVDLDVHMVDQFGYQHNTDPATGVEIGPESDPNLIYMVSGCVWNNYYATLTKNGARGGGPKALVLEQLAWAGQLIPMGKTMRYDTRLDYLIEQWQDMIGWKECGYVGLDRDACMRQRRDVMKEDQDLMNDETIVESLMIQEEKDTQEEKTPVKPAHPKKNTPHNEEAIMPVRLEETPQECEVPQGPQNTREIKLLLRMTNQ